MKAWLLVPLLSLVGCATAYGDRRIVVPRPGCNGELVIDSDVNGRHAGQGPSYADLFEDTVVFSADGQHEAFVARLENGWVVEHDGRTSRRWSGVGFLRYGPNGPVYAVPEKDQWCVVRAEVVDPCFSSLLEDSLTFAGSSVAYVAVEASGDAALVVNGAVSTRGGVLALVRGSDDGQHFGVVERAGKTGGDDTLRVDGLEVTRAQRVLDWTLAGGGTWLVKRDAGVFGENASGRLGPWESASQLLTRGAHVAYSASNALGAFVVLDGVAFGPFEAVEADTLTLSPSGEDFAIAARVDKKVVVATSKQRLAPRRQGSVERCTELRFSADGRTLGVLAANEQGEFSVSVHALATGLSSWEQVGFSGASDLSVGVDGGAVVALVRHKADDFAVLERGSGGEPTLTALRAMPGTLVVDDATHAWSVLAGDDLTHRLVIGRSWDVTPIAFDSRSFATEVVRLQRQGVEAPVVAAWRSQAQMQLTRHLGCAAK